MGARIRKNDDVIVIGGKDRGKTGKVLRIDRNGQRVYVEGLNIIKRHRKPEQVRGAQRAEQVGGVIEQEGPIHISNVALARPQGRQADPHRSDPRGRQGDPRGKALGNEAGRLMAARSIPLRTRIDS